MARTSPDREAPPSICAGRCSPRRRFRVWREIVGVVSSVRHKSKAVPPDPEMFVPWNQSPGAIANIVMRTSGAPENSAADLRRWVAAIDAELPVVDMRAMESRLAQSVAEPRFRTVLLGAFAA